MAIEAQQAAVCIKKVLRSSIRKGYRFLSEHPVLFSLGVLLYLLYRSSPGLFAFLLSSSPVIICTTLLLGILLSYGEIDLPEASDDRKGTPEISAYKVGTLSSDVQSEENQRLSVPEFRENMMDFKERETKQTFLDTERAREHVDLYDDVPLLRRVDEEDERSELRSIPGTLTPFPSMVNLRQNVGIGEGLNFHKERDLEGSFFIQDRADGRTSLFDGAPLKADTSLGLLSSNENLNSHVGMEENINQERIFTNTAASNEKQISEENRTEGFAGTSKTACASSVHQWRKDDGLNVDTSNAVEDNLLDSSLGSPWARVSSQDDSSGFDSDGAESSSPDASMTDIAPVLDEIDPLLGANSIQTDPIPKDDSDIDSHISEDHQIDDDSNDEGDDKDTTDKLEGKKKDDGKGAVFLWTADDEKNLMDLGYSEMERNRRLEILMARRRSRKNIIFEIDSNLIDTNDAGRSLDDLSRFRAQVSHISVPRRNPFDPSYDYEEAGIPGSAPSILHARKNPFDLPLEQTNGTGVPAHDSSNSEESVASSRRDMFFRRHDSFSFGRTDGTQERHASRLKPYFVPETVEWSASNLQRQFSDKSESKLSSVTESDLVSSVADQEDHKDLCMEHDSPALLRQDSDLADVGSECSDSINSVDVELDNSEIDDREIALQHFVFERSQEREACATSTKEKGCEEDYTLKTPGNSTISFHPVPDLLSWEGDGESSLGAKPSYGPNTDIQFSEWAMSSRPAEGESSSGDLQEYLDTQVASRSSTVVLGASNPAEDGGNIDLMSYSNNEVLLDSLIHGSMELPSEFVKETLPVISRDLHPIPEERVVENFNMQGNHETTIFTDSAAALNDLHVIEEHFDVGFDGSLNSAIASSNPEGNDAIQSPSSEPAEVSDSFVSMATEPIMVDTGDMKEEETAGYLLDSDDEDGKIYPEPMEDSGIDESFLSELDAVGDFGVDLTRLHQQVPDRGSQSDNPTNGVASDSVITPQTSGNISMSMSEGSVVDSREQSPFSDDLNGPEFSWSCGASHGDPEQTVYNPRIRILEASPLEAENTELNLSRGETEVPSGDNPAATLAAASSIPDITKNDSMITTTDPEMMIPDAKSLEDMETAFKLVREGALAENSTDAETSHISDVSVDTEPKEVAGLLHVIDATSVDDIHAAIEEHCDLSVNSSLEENKDKNGHGGTPESTKHYGSEAIYDESPLNVEDGREAEPAENSSSRSSSEIKTHGDLDAMLKKLSDGSGESTTQAMDSEDACESKEGSEQQ